MMETNIHTIMETNIHRRHMERSPKISLTYMPTSGSHFKRHLKPFTNPLTNVFTTPF